jgi:hypothetical protein
VLVGVAVATGRFVGVGVAGTTLEVGVTVAGGEVFVRVAVAGSGAGVRVGVFAGVPVPSTISWSRYMVPE